MGDLPARRPAHFERLLAEVFRCHTLTLRVRARLVGRYVSERDTSAVETEHGPMRVKRNWLAGEVVSAAA